MGVSPVLPPCVPCILSVFIPFHNPPQLPFCFVPQHHCAMSHNSPPLCPHISCCDLCLQFPGIFSYSSLCACFFCNSSAHGALFLLYIVPLVLFPLSHYSFAPCPIIPLHTVLPSSLGVVQYSIVYCLIVYSVCVVT